MKVDFSLKLRTVMLLKFEKLRADVILFKLLSELRRKCSLETL